MCFSFNSVTENDKKFEQFDPYFEIESLDSRFQPNFISQEF